MLIVRRNRTGILTSCFLCRFPTDTCPHPEKAANYSVPAQSWTFHIHPMTDSWQDSDTCGARRAMVFTLGLVWHLAPQWHHSILLLIAMTTKLLHQYYEISTYNYSGLPERGIAQSSGWSIHGTCLWYLVTLVGGGWMLLRNWLTWFWLLSL